MILKYSVNDLVATFNDVIEGMTFKEFLIKKIYLETPTFLLVHLLLLLPQNQCHSKV